MSDSLLGGNPTPTPNPTPEPTPEPTPAPSVPEWLSGIEGVDSEIIGDPSLKAINDIPNLVKSYVHAQKMMGSDKVVIPKQDAPADEWNQFYAKLGKPSDLEQFAVNKPEESPLDDTFLNNFKQAAFEANLLPHQAQALLDSINKSEQEANTQFAEASQAKVAEAIEGLKTEWGDSFETNVNAASKAAQEYGGQEFTNYLNETGLGNDPMLIKIFAKIGEGLVGGEDQSASGSQSSQSTGMTKDEAKLKYAEILNDPNDLYHHPDKAGHKQRIDQVNNLFKFM